MAELSRELTVTVDVDVSEALTGLKALQREAKKATQLLREVEAVAIDKIQVVGVFPEGIDLSRISTEELQRELSKREGVETYEIAPHTPTSKLLIDDGYEGTVVRIEGPAVITINKD